MATPLITRLAHPEEETVVAPALPGFVEIHRLASPLPASVWPPSFAIDRDVSPGPSAPLANSPSAITWTTRSLVVVGTVSLSPVRSLVETSRTTSPSGPGCATPVNRIADTASSFGPLYGFATTIV